MDGGSLMLSLLFGSIGMGMFVYGRKAGRVVPLGAGAALIALPYLLPNALTMLFVCPAVMAVPWLLRDG